MSIRSDAPQLMGEHDVACPYSRVAFGSEKEQRLVRAVLCRSMDGHGKIVKGAGHGRPHVVFLRLYETLRRGEFIETKSRPLVTWGWQKARIRGWDFFLGY